MNLIRIYSNDKGRPDTASDIAGTKDYKADRKDRSYIS